MKSIDFEQKLYFVWDGKVGKILQSNKCDRPPSKPQTQFFLEINEFHVMQFFMILKKLAKIDRLNETSASLFGHTRTGSERAAVAKQLV